MPSRGWGKVVGREGSPFIQASLLWAQDLALIHRATGGKSLCFSGPQFPHLSQGDNDITLTLKRDEHNAKAPR